MMIKEFCTQSEEETFALGKKFAGCLAPGSCVLLHGLLGAGKTVFVRGVCSAFGIDASLVRSPTFTLVNEYHSGKIPVAHVDLYRLEGDKNSVSSLFLEEYVDDGFILIIEWAENGDFSVNDAFKIDIKIDEKNSDVRIFTILPNLRL